MPPPVDLDPVPFLHPLVATFRLVCALKQPDLRYLAAAKVRGRCPNALGTGQQ